MTRTTAMTTSRSLREVAPAWAGAPRAAALPTYAGSKQARIRLRALEPPR